MTHLLTEKETAKYIGLSVSWLRQKRCHGQLGNSTPAPQFIKIGRAVRYPKEELDKWLSQFRRLNHLSEHFFRDNAAKQG